jgi:ATP-dependent RNA helicase SUPV3L1/SUV3
VQSVCSGKARSLPPELDWLRSSSPKHLEEAEALSQDISLYAWLAGKFPHVFHEADIVPAFRSQVSRYIERALLTQAGYGSISKELLYQY